MKRDQHGVALIPARGGSKGIPQKNLAPLAGKPLIQYAIEAARDSGVIDEVFVSSDSDAILDTAQRLGAKPLRRPAELATDTASSDSVIAHFIEAMDLARRPSLPIVLLQPTSPLRTGVQVAQAVQVWQRTDAQAVVSVFEPEHHPAKAFKLDEQGMLAGLYGADAPFTPRQALPRAYQPNGAVYVFSVEAFLRGSCIPRDHLAPLVMGQRESLDIDCAADLERAALYLRGEH